MTFLCLTFLGFVLTPVIVVLNCYRFSKLSPTHYLPFLTLLPLPSQILGFMLVSYPTSPWKLWVYIWI